MMNISQLKTLKKDDKIKFQMEDASTNWMDESDSFIRRIEPENLNKIFITRHLIKEIEIKNLLDEGTAYLKSGKYPKAIGCFDEVIFYDGNYFEALINKSRALFGQKHFVKALRYYKKAVNAGFEGDVQYHKLLLTNANRERDGFPKIKLNIYAGDEFFTRGDYHNALKSYEKALVNPSKFKEKILFKLLNKKATKLVQLNQFESALHCFNESLNVENNDYAYYGKGLCEYKLNLEGAGDSLEHAHKINKSQLAEKGVMLNELGRYSQALETFDYLLENHYDVDEIYMKSLKGKMYAMSELNMDISEIEGYYNLFIDRN